jgi:SAM-dependent MidA family methyltransferase
MAMCLYDDEYGYYRSGKVRIGKQGDFYTSSAVGSVMGDKLAAYAAGLIESFGGAADSAEWGAGTGRLSRHILAAWKRAGHEWLHLMTYAIVDGNPVHLAEAERELRLDDTAESLAEVRCLTESEAEALEWRRRPVIVFANELLDAFPVHRVKRKNGQLWELGVSCSEGLESGGAFRYVYMPLSDERIRQSLYQSGINLAEGQIVEVNLAAEDWISAMSGRIERGALILIDYGHEAPELTAPHRMHGTLLCYRNHIACDNPLENPGEQDITAHVNFTACRRAAEASGWTVDYYATQKRFLVDQGVLDDLTAHDGRDPFGDSARRNRAIRQLLLSDGMSETFKVMTLVKR